MSVARTQKQEWCRVHLGLPVSSVITCLSKNKHEYSSRHHILIDDRESHRDRWESKGGVFIHHTSTRSTIASLEAVLKRGVDVKRKESEAEQLVRITIKSAKGGRAVPIVVRSDDWTTLFQIAAAKLRISKYSRAFRGTHRS